MSIIVTLIRRKVSPGRKERTGDTHCLYAYWEQNGLAYKNTICCNRETYVSQMTALVTRVHAAAVKKGASDISLSFNPDILVSPE